MLLACLCAMVLSTCGVGSSEAGHPDGAPSTPQPIPTSARPTAPPDRPTTAKGLTLAAAGQFVRYYSDLMNYAADTGDTAALRQASDSGCENCKTYADFIEKSNAANGLLIGDFHEHITQVQQLTLGKPGFAGGSATLSVGAYTSQETKADTALVSKPSQYTREFALSAQAGNWVMYEMKQTKQRGRRSTA